MKKVHHAEEIFHHALQQCGLIAILRGMRPDEVEAIGLALYEAGFRVIEVPLNSPEPFAKHRVRCATYAAGRLHDRRRHRAVSRRTSAQVKDAGGELIVMPHSDARSDRAPPRMPACAAHPASPP
jgi:2-dehydro-3-deoxyphosphogalactonate aldolase